MRGGADRLEVVRPQVKAEVVRHRRVALRGIGAPKFPPARIGALQKRVVSRLVVEFCRGRDPSPSADLPRLCELVSVVSKLKLADEEFAKGVREVEACFSLLANPKPTAAQVNLAAETSTKLLQEKTGALLQGSDRVARWDARDGEDRDVRGG